LRRNPTFCADYVGLRDKAANPTYAAEFSPRRMGCCRLRKPA